MISSLKTYDESLYGETPKSQSFAMVRSARRGPWLPEEDQALLQLVRTQGANNWVRISQQLQHRSPKQCRERYHQNLKPSLKHDPISVQEGEVIEQLVQEMGKRWAEIARRLGNRSDNAVKNWWNGSVNRRRRNSAQPSASIKQIGSRLQPIPFTLPPAGRKTTQLSTCHLDDEESSQTCAMDRDSQPQANRGSQQIQQGSFNITPHVQTLSIIRDPGLSASVLPNIYTSDLRNDAPASRSSASGSSRLGKSYCFSDAFPLSPGASDGSQRQPPSLISDSQSNYSVSPRTASSPRLNLPVPVEIRRPSWTSSLGPLMGIDQSGFYRSTSFSDAAPKFNISSHNKSRSRHIGTVQYDNEQLKDARMNVSTLLQ